MAAPTAPTLITITTEALKKAGYDNPTAAQLSRAQDYWMAEIKNDIWGDGKKLTSLQTTAVMTLVKGRSIYSMPTDFAALCGTKLLDGEETGTAQAGASGTITLKASSAITEGFAQGKEILITGGTGVDQISQMYAYNTTTKVASVSPSWATNPSSDSTYLIVDDYFTLKESPVWDYDKENHPNDLGRPLYYNPIGDSDSGEFILSPTPDDTYGLKIRYYANLTTLDLAGTLMSTLYNKWRNIWIQGVFAKCLQYDDDDRYQAELGVYNNMRQSTILREQYGMDLSNLGCSVEDY